MKVLLINPNLEYPVVSFKGIYRYNYILPPLELVNIAALIQREGFIVKILDLNAERQKINKKNKEIIDADVIIVTTAPLQQWQCPPLSIEHIKLLLKNISEDKIIVVIGPHGTIDPLYLVKELGSIIIVRGEPELTVLELLIAMRKETSFKNIKGISYIDKDELINNPNRDRLDLKKLLIPSFELLPMSKYFYDLIGEKFSIIETSRGCSSQCNFCFKMMHGNEHRTKSVDQVIEEISYLTNNFEVRNIWFADLDFAFNKGHVRRLCDRIIKEKLKFHWVVQTRVDHLDEDLLRLMKKSGCKIIQYGAASGDNEILKYIGKGITIEKIESMFNLTKKVGIKTLAYFMIGYPNEDKSQILKTIRFSKHLDPDYATFHIVTPYPGTKMHSDLNNETINFPVYASKKYSLKELNLLKMYAHVYFYFRWKYIFRMIRGDFSAALRGFKNLFMPLMLRLLAKSIKK